MNIYIEKETDTEFDFPDYEEAIRNAAAAVAEDKALPAELDVNVLIVCSGEMRKINAENRGIDAVTDVLSFPYYEYEEAGIFEGEVFEGEENILGDIILCSEKAIAQAKEYGHSQKRELSFLVVHSMLHLLGYDHMEDEERREMEEQQRKYMEILGILR